MSGGRVGNILVVGDSTAGSEEVWSSGLSEFV